MLIRSVIWKCRNSGYSGSFYILADESGCLGTEEYQTTKKLLLTDSKIRPKPVIDFCTTGNSNSCGAMQVSDLCTGAVMSKYDSSYSSQTACLEFSRHLVNINSGIELNFSPRNLPKINDLKLHHCLHRNA